MKARHISRHSRRKGFTALEILVVLAIIGMLIAVGVTQFDNIFRRGEESTARIFVNESIRVPLMSFRVDMGRYPTTEEGLQALATAPANRAERWRGPYVEGGRIPLDPWGNPYQYRYPGTRNPGSYDVWSLGPDGVESGDDIGNW